MLSVAWVHHSLCTWCGTRKDFNCTWHSHYGIWALGHGERKVWVKITNRPGCIRETQTQFPFLQTPKGFYPPIVATFWIMNAWENKMKTRRLWSLFFFSSHAWGTLCLDSCSLCRCWHRLNKYLCIALMYPFTSRSINIYLRVKCNGPPLPAAPDGTV